LFFLTLIRQIFFIVLEWYYYILWSYFFLIDCLCLFGESISGDGDGAVFWFKTYGLYSNTISRWVWRSWLLLMGTKSWYLSRY